MMEHLLPERDQQLLAAIHPGMAVYDMHRQHIGTVDEVHFGATSPYGRGATQSSDVSQPDASIIQKVAKAFSGDHIPGMLHARIMQHGYVRLARKGSVASHHYIRLSQIARVDGNGVHLQATEETLVKG